MGLRKIKGLANDLAHALYSANQRNPMSYFKEKHTNVIEEKDDFDKFCLNFFKERLPDFDISRFKKIYVYMNWLTVKVVILVDDKEFSCCVE